MHRATAPVDLHLVAVHAIEEGARGVRAIGVVIAERRGIPAGVPLLAGCHAGMAADAGVEVDDEAELLRRLSGQAGHARATSGLP
jgi:hypothetical protein